MQGKDFLGWCTKQPKEDGSCTGVVVQPAGCFPLCKCDLDLTLYAMYGTKSTGGGGSYTDDGKGCIHSGIAGYVVKDKCWMWQDYTIGTTDAWNWSNAKTVCPSGWTLPTRDDFQSLLDTIGTGAQLYNAGWRNSNVHYWSSTPDGSDAYSLYVSWSSAGVYGNPTSSTNGVRCVSQ